MEKSKVLSIYKIGINGLKWEVHEYIVLAHDSDEAKELVKADSTYLLEQIYVQEVIDLPTKPVIIATFMFSE